MQIDRRGFLLRGGAWMAAFGLPALLPLPPLSFRAPSFGRGFGPLLPDPAGILDLPEGFSYRVVSQAGERMSDGLRVPGRPDGMGCMRGPGGATLLFRNHELDQREGPDALSGAAPAAAAHASHRVYDRGTGERDGDVRLRPNGAVTSLLYDTRRHTRLREQLCLAGTMRNCSGGMTPWGSWISCEEWTHTPDERSGAGLARLHGFAFEVSAAGGPPVPLVAMGRFRREAVAVDPRSGIVYQTEDRPDGLLYRFVPRRPGALAAGGRLEALGVAGLEGASLANHWQRALEVSRPVRAFWVPLDDPASPRDDLRERGREAGAVTFNRGEGIVAEAGSVFFVASRGGPHRCGQFFRYTPSPSEGGPGEARAPGRLELVAEPADPRLASCPDTLAPLAPALALFSEDPDGPGRVRGLTAGGEVFPFADNPRDGSELTGLSFSPDGSTLFVNLQEAGITLAVEGRWSGLHT